MSPFIAESEVRVNPRASTVINARLLTLWVKIENLAYDLPLTVNLQQSEHVSELVAGPIVEFETNSGNGAD